jgi:transposase
MARRVGAGESVLKVASDFCVSEQTVRKWVRRWQSGGPIALLDRSSRPARLRGTPAERVAEIEGLRRQRMSSPAIARQLGLPISTVIKILRRLGLNRLKTLDPPVPVVRYERAHPGELIHMDTKKLGRIAGIGHRITGRRTGAINRHHGIGWECLHVCIGDASRLAYSEVLPDERKESATGFLERALAWFARNGVAVERVMTDNGNCYRSDMFRQACASQGLRHLRTRPYTPRTNAHHRMTADPVIGTPQLVALLKERIGRNPDLAGKIAARAAETGKRHQRLRANWRKEAEEHWNMVPMTVPRLALEVWRVIKDENWVLSAGTLNQWARKLWDFDRPYRHAGRELGTGTQIGTSLGVALANKGSGRLVVDLQPDGDLMYDAGALWMAAKYQIPLLIVMYNNRAYYNDWNHQIVMARTRGTDPSRAHIGMDLFGPAPDFAGLARSMGWWAEGPIENADDLQPALQRAVAQVKNGKPALVDAVTQHR